MACDLIQAVFPGAAVAWERTPRVKPERLVVKEGSETVADVLQEHISDHYRGPGLDELQLALDKLKAAKST